MAETLALSKGQFYIFVLREAAKEWLAEHAGDPNAPAVQAALVATGPIENEVMR